MALAKYFEDNIRSLERSLEHNNWTERSPREKDLLRSEVSALRNTIREMRVELDRIYREVSDPAVNRYLELLIEFREMKKAFEASESECEATKGIVLRVTAENAAHVKEISLLYDLDARCVELFKRNKRLESELRDAESKLRQQSNILESSSANFAVMLNASEKN